MSIQYMVPGFEHRTFGARGSRPADLDFVEVILICLILSSYAALNYFLS